MTLWSSSASLQTESSEYIHPKDLSPNAVSSAGAAAVAPPKFQIALIELSEGDEAAPGRFNTRSGQREERGSTPGDKHGADDAAQPVAGGRCLFHEHETGDSGDPDEVHHAADE